MHNFSRHRFWLLAALISCALSNTTYAQQPPAAAHQIHPTVTAQQGDPGGKYFGRTPEPSKTRRYYIAAEPQSWDFAPQGCQGMCHPPLSPALTNKRNATKLRYVQYTDDTFQAKVIETPRLGLLGPVLRGVVGEYLVITFLNRTSRPLSLHPHGVRYDKDSEGAYYEPSPGRGAAVGPGAQFTYVWQLDEASGPRAEEPSSKGWLYHSHVNGDEEVNLGLIGSIIVTDPRRARPDGTPLNVDREMAALFLIFDESGLGQAEKEAAEYGLPGKTWVQIQELLEQGARYAINGYTFGNLRLEVNEGERVRWYLFALGSEQDFHTAHWHGLRVVEEGRRRTDVVELLPASMKVADMVADNPGEWMLHCHVSEHMTEGMFAKLTVHPKGTRRAGEPTFFGLRRDEQSLRIHRATVQPDCTPKALPPCRLHIEGVATVYQAFSVFTEAVSVQIGEKTVRFKPGASATQPDANFRIKNANPFGVVYGGLLEFELTLSGADWLREIQKRTNAQTKTQRPEVSLRVQIGRITHMILLPPNGAGISHPSPK